MIEQQAEVQVLPDDCPVCNYPVREGFFFCHPEDESRYQIFCMNCEYESEWSETLEAAIIGWNKLLRTKNPGSRAKH